MFVDRAIIEVRGGFVGRRAFHVAVRPGGTGARGATWSWRSMGSSRHSWISATSVTTTRHGDSTERGVTEQDETAKTWCSWSPLEP
jgi:hypothetical protein